MQRPLLAVLASLLCALPSAHAAGFRTVGSSGCASQMAFNPPNTSTVVFIDNYHANYGGPGVNLLTGAPSPTSYIYPGTLISVFGTEYDLRSNSLRPLQPKSNTFCSAGAFYPDGTLVNIAGAEPDPIGIADGFKKIRTYAGGPCKGNCSQDWVEQAATLQHERWYPSAQTLVDGSVLIVGGADKGGLVLNEANINVPTYEVIFQDGRTPPAPVGLPILNFTEDENLVPGKSYNLYPMLYLLPNSAATNQIFTLAGNRSVIWDYTANSLIKNLPDISFQPRTFPSSATSVLLPLEAPNYDPTILICGGSSGDIPNPIALSDCYTISPNDPTPSYIPTDSLPNGPQTMTDGILLPDSTVLLLNGARTGCGGGFMADDPVISPLIYNASAPLGQRFTTMPATTIPRLYHSTAILLPSGEVIVSGSNPAVGYSASGTVGPGWPSFGNNGHTCALRQQQRNTSAYSTEYRVEIFSPSYMDAPARPVITSSPHDMVYNSSFSISATINGQPLQGEMKVVLSHPGFHTHGQGMGQRMAVLGADFGDTDGGILVKTPRDPSVMPPGQYLMFVTSEGIPSEGVWIEVGA